MSVRVTEYRAHTCACPCGTRTAAAFPEHLAASPSSYRPHLRTLAVYLMVFQHIPVERTAGLIADVTGAQVSTGWVSALLGQAHGLVADSLKLIRTLLTLAHVLHVDETTTRIKDQRCWLHVACTGHLTMLGPRPPLAGRSRVVGHPARFHRHFGARQPGVVQRLHRLCPPVVRGAPDRRADRR